MDNQFKDQQQIPLVKSATASIENTATQPLHDTKIEQAKKNVRSAVVTPSPATAPVEGLPTTPLPVKKSRRWLLRRGLFVGGAAFISGGAYSAWRFVIVPSQVPNVSVYRAATRSVPFAIGGSGIFYPLQQVDISYPDAELVLAVKVNAGDKVVRNQSLIQLDSGQISLQIKQAEDDLAAAQAYLNSVSASGSQVNIAQAQQSYNVAQSRYNTLVAQAATPLRHHGDLVSPMNGVVTTINANPGQIVAANVPLLTIMDESTVVVHAKVPLVNLGQVRSGQSATVTPSALPELSVPGLVTAVIPQADPQTDTFEVWVSVVNTHQALLPGMSAFVHIQSTTDAFALPRLAVLNVDSNPQVFVVDDSQRARLRSVHVIGRTPDLVYVDHGLATDDQVVLVGINNILDGQSVHVTQVTN